MLFRSGRATLVDAFDAERTRIERDLHDGAQRELVALTMALGVTRLNAQSLDERGRTGELRASLLADLDTAQDRAEEALRSLRETVRGIRPTVLTEKFNENLKLYLISYLFRFEVDEITENLATEFLENLLRLFSILELVDLGYSSSKFKTFLFGLNIKLVDKNISLSEIKQEINRHINDGWERKEIEDAVRNYTKNSLEIGRAHV